LTKNVKGKIKILDFERFWHFFSGDVCDPPMKRDKIILCRGAGKTGQVLESKRKFRFKIYLKRGNRK